MTAVACMKPGCAVTWPRDPVLEVACPVCVAPVGARCRRPSGHRAWRGFFHATRDILADQQGKYGPCPTRRCGLAAGKTEQMELFA